MHSMRGMAQQFTFIPLNLIGGLLFGDPLFIVPKAWLTSRHKLFQGDHGGLGCGVPLGLPSMRLGPARGLTQLRFSRTCRMKGKTLRQWLAQGNVVQGHVGPPPHTRGLACSAGDLHIRWAGLPS